jgi:hypothetical protein
VDVEVRQRVPLRAMVVSNAAITGTISAGRR